jgi:hypothetical protein
MDDSFAARLREALACDTCRRYRRAALAMLALLIASWILLS